MPSARAQRLIDIRTSLENIVKAQTAAWEAAGCPPTISVDGESYQWDSWLTSKLDAISKLSEQIRAASPYMVHSRARG